MIAEPFCVIFGYPQITQMDADGGCRDEGRAAQPRVRLLAARHLRLICVHLRHLRINVNGKPLVIRAKKTGQSEFPVPLFPVQDASVAEMRSEFTCLATEQPKLEVPLQKLTKSSSPGLSP